MISILIPKNSSKTSFILFIVKFFKLLGFGRGILKKILSFFLKKYIGSDSVLYRYHGLNFLLYPQLNSTDAKMIISSRFLENDEINYVKKNLNDLNLCFFDIGANIGYYSLLLNKYFNKIYAFEPIPGTINKLKSNIAINQLDSKIEVIGKGVGEKNYIGNIFEDQDNIGNSSILINGKKNILHEIEIINLIDFIKQRKIDKIGLIKIDIEGYEDRALMPLLTYLNDEVLPKIIILEHSNSNLWEHDLIYKLKIRGYKLISTTRGNSIYLNIGGESGIRTHGRVTPTLPFQGSAIDHSAISPINE